MGYKLPVALAAGAACAGALAYAAVHPAAQIFGPTLRRTASPDTLALTFDDGPNPALTPKLLDLLEAHSAPATFFLVGRHVRACPEVVREIAARGHAIGNHTETHPHLTWKTPARVREEVAGCHDALGAVLNRAPRWMRPPYGHRGPQLWPVLRTMGYGPIVTWTDLCGDWRPQAPEKLIGRLGRVRPRAMVVLHDGSPFTLGAERGWVLAALAHWLPRWRDAGLRFVTVEECAAWPQ
jgi:peptidoglycan/xylan/chitin deacetylase (PgdA/CDA1 family)